MVKGDDWSQSLKRSANELGDLFLTGNRPINGIHGNISNKENKIYLLIFTMNRTIYVFTFEEQVIHLGIMN